MRPASKETSFWPCSSASPAQIFRRFGGGSVGWLFCVAAVFKTFLINGDLKGFDDMLNSHVGQINWAMMSISF